MKQQLYDFTYKWWGAIPRETDLCSFTLKTIIAMLKFGGLVALVLQPIVFGSMGWTLAINYEMQPISFYIILNMAVLWLYGCAIVIAAGFWYYDNGVPYTGSIIEKLIERSRCGKTIKF
jgi:hypothetical protein